MNKVWLGILLGGVLGVFDGLTALFYPEVASQIVGIVIGSTVKGIIAGMLIGFFARKVNSLPLGILFGLAVGLLLAFAVAAIPDPSGKHYYFEIMLPGSIVGIIVGYATQKFGRRPASARAVEDLPRREKIFSFQSLCLSFSAVSLSFGNFLDDFASFFLVD
jgi:hypothetical protein